MAAAAVLQVTEPCVPDPAEFRSLTPSWARPRGGQDVVAPAAAAPAVAPPAAPAASDAASVPGDQVKKKNKKKAQGQAVSAAGSGAAAAPMVAAAGSASASAASASAAAASSSSSSANKNRAPPSKKTRSLDCPNCLESFEPKEGPRYPRILTPCAHTFCTECIERQLAARGTDAFRCLLHDSPVLGVSKAADAWANFALIELLEKVQQDADHQVVDERAAPPSCAECDEPALWYCKNDDACFCDAHKASEHQSKSRVNHVIVPVAECSAKIPKCTKHLTEHQTIWCKRCATLCCGLCAHFGEHKECAAELVLVEKVIAQHRETIAQLAEQAKEASDKMLDPAARRLLEQRAAFKQSVDAAHTAVKRMADEAVEALTARAIALDRAVDLEATGGLKLLDLRLDELTMCRSETAMVSEEAARVLRMNDYAVLKHAASVTQAAERAERSLAQYHAVSLLPEPMKFLAEPALLLDEIDVAGSTHVSYTQVKDGKLVTDPEEPHALTPSKRSAEVEQLRDAAEKRESAHAKQIDELTAAVDKAAQEHQTLLAQLKTASSQREAATKAADAHKEQLQKVEAALKAAEADSAQLRAKLTADQKTAQQKLKSLQDENAQLAKRASEKDGGAQLKAAEEKVRQLEAAHSKKVAQLEAEKVTLGADKLSLGQRIAALTKQVGDLTAEKEALVKKGSASAAATVQLKAALGK